MYDHSPITSLQPAYILPHLSISLLLLVTILLPLISVSVRHLLCSEVLAGSMKTLFIIFLFYPFMLHFLYSALDKIITGNIPRRKPTEIFNR
jgi:hypothetical protein